VRNNVTLNFSHLQKRTEQINHLSENEFTPIVFKNMLKERIEKTNIEAVKNDLRPFLRKPQEMEIWSCSYFLQLIDMMQLNKS